MLFFDFDCLRRNLIRLYETVVVTLMAALNLELLLILIIDNAIAECVKLVLVDIKFTFGTESGRVLVKKPLILVLDVLKVLVVAIEHDDGWSQAVVIDLSLGDVL